MESRLFPRVCSHGMSGGDERKPRGPRGILLEYAGSHPACHGVRSELPRKTAERSRGVDDTPTGARDPVGEPTGTYKNTFSFFSCSQVSQLRDR